MNTPDLNCSHPYRRAASAWTWIAFIAALWINGCGRKKEPVASGNRTTAQAEGESEANLLKINAALAATENLEPEQAGKMWSELRERFPDDPSVALNRALNAVLQVDALTASATDSVKTSEEKKAARAVLPDAIEAARAAIDDYQQNSGEQVTPLWLSSRIDAHEATLLGRTFSKSLRRDLFQKLSKGIDGPSGDEPAAIILGGPLIELLEKMSDPVDGLPQEILTPAAVSLQRLSDKNEANLFVALRALRLAVDKRDDAAIELVNRTWDLARAVEPTLAAYTKPIGVTPEELKQQIIDAITRADWAKADQSLVLWSNVLSPLEIVRTDRRRASPHPLDRLNFDTVRRLSAEIAGALPIAPGDAPITFSTDTIETDARLVLPIDADLDLDVDLISVSGDRRLRLFTRENGRWIPSADLQLEVQPIGLLAADLFMVDSSDSDRIKRGDRRLQGDDGERDYSMKVRHNTLPVVILFGDFGMQAVQVDTREPTPADQRLALITEATGLEGLPAIGSVTTGDLEGDGDLDLIVAPRDGQIRTFINRGNRTFFEVAVGTQTVPADDPVADMAIADLDRDIDLDIVTLHRSGRVGILENLLHLQFRFRYLDAVPPLSMAADKSALSIAVEDVDSNVGWDVIATSSEQSMIAFGHSPDIGVWSVDRVETGPGFRSRPALADFDNDSYLELVGGDQALKLGPWGLNMLKPVAGLPVEQWGGAMSDVDGDGNVDLIMVGPDVITIGRNQGAGDAHQLSVRFKGIADNAAASGRVNHYAIGSVLELRFGPHFRSRIVTQPATHFGLDGIDSVDSIRVIMPNGLTQTIRNPKVDSVIEEEQTLKGSCPYLYSWDGETFAFVTDCLWAAPLGLQVAAGVVQKDRPWEYLKIDGRFVRENQAGQYELRLTEELWEVAYVDKIALTAVDHPSDVEVFSNEKVGPPGVATPTIFSFGQRDLLPVVEASGTRGQDVTEQLSKSDQRYVKGFDRRIRQGLCEPHWIDLDFGAAAKQRLASTDQPSAYLVLRGWILPTDTSLNIQIDQNPELPKVEFPSVWIPDDAEPNGWRKVIPFMGFPGGKTKTIVVDVTEHVDSEDPRFRVRTSAQIYWDSASLAVQEMPQSIVTAELELMGAEVAFHGFSRRLKTDPSGPETYDYAHAEQSPKWPPLRGTVSDFGDCTEKLAEWDDSMVVISGGDEIRMRFQPPPDEVPSGWKRDFILHCVGWDKDADLNTLTGQSIGPLPIRDMRGYPPTIESSQQFDAVRLRNEDSRRRRQSFRAFWRGGAVGAKPFLITPESG